MSSESVDRGIGLLSDIASGSENALIEFYGAYRNIVYSFVLKRLKDPMHAEDVLNEVMMEVWRVADRFEGRSKVTTWLLGIANHKAIDKLRKLKRHTGMDDIDEHHDVHDEDTVVASVAIENSEDAELVRKCIEALSENHRMVVHLAFYQDLAYNEISEIIECPEGTVKTRMFHARKQLHDCVSNGY